MYTISRMLHAIRRGPVQAATEPTQLVLECHGRMRGFLDMATRLASAGDAPAKDVADAARAIRRYFAQALPLHEADEERSIAPRLLASAARAEVEDALGTMTAQHREAEALLAALDPKWARAVDEPAALASIAAVLAEETRALRALLDGHLAMEEAHVVPAIARALDAALRAEILGEMKQRRGQSFTG